jgi:hypothetical protein
MAKPLTTEYSANPNHGLTLNLMEIISLIGFVAGIVLITTNLETGLIILALSLVHLFVAQRGVGTTRATSKKNLSNYSLWLIDKSRQICETYNSPQDLSNLSLAQYTNSSLYLSFPLNPLEFSCLDLICAATGVTPDELATKALSGDSLSLLQIENKTYSPRRPFARLLLAISEDGRLGDFPVAAWLVEGKSYLFSEISHIPIDAVSKVGDENK